MELLERIYNAGVVGAGGAGFPTHKKLVKDAAWLIVNAAECEPLLNSDRYVMRTFAAEIIEALDMIQAEFHVGKVVIGLKKKYKTEIAALQNAINEKHSMVELFYMESIYPAGDEQILVYEVTGQTVPPGGIPIQVGAVVSNVTTVLNVYEASKDTPVLKKFVTVTGEVQQPVIVEVPVGTSVCDCIEAAGGATVTDYVFIMGGPMMGKQYEEKDAQSVYIKKTDGAVIVLPKDHHVRTFNQITVPHIVNQAKSACIQCSYCTEMCPRYLIGHQLRPHKVMRSLSTGTDPMLLQDALLCCECGICEMYACPMQLSPRKVNIHIKNLLRESGVGVSDKKIHAEQIELRNGRQIPQLRLINRLGLSKYPTEIQKVAKLTPSKVSISLKHGIGKPAQATVAVGDTVSVGDCIATVAFAEVGARVHASISGVVTEVSSCITIAKAGS